MSLNAAMDAEMIAMLVIEDAMTAMRGECTEGDAARALFRQAARNLASTIGASKAATMCGSCDDELTGYGAQFVPSPRRAA